MLKDVARIELGAGSYGLRSLLNNKTAVAIPIFQTPGANALELSKNVRAKMEELKRLSVGEAQYARWWRHIDSPETPPRRVDDSRFPSLDWYSAHLLAVAIGISLLSVADAFFTLTLLQGGASEMNPLMALFVYRNVAVFAAMKIGLTSASIVLMVVLARHRFMRLVQVTWVLYGVLIAYASLIAYELWMLKGSPDLPIL